MKAVATRRYAEPRGSSVRAAAAFLGAGSVVAGVAAGHLVASGHGRAAFALALVCLAFVWWNRPGPEPEEPGAVTTPVGTQRDGEAPRGWSARVVPAFLGAACVVAGAIAGQLDASGRTGAVLALAVVILPVVLWRKPELGPTVLVVAALTVEQFDHFRGVGPTTGALTTRLPLFHGVGPVPLNPADLLLCLLFAIYVLKVGTGATRPWPRSATSTAVFCLLAAVAAGVLLGIARGGAPRIAFLEARPYVYLAATFVLASVLLTTRTAMRAVLWGLVLAIGFKAAQGLMTFLSVRHQVPRPEAVLAHEEALFFALFLLLTVALWLFDVPGPLRTTATFLAPIVLAADLANQRRAAWLVLAAGFAALATVAFVAVPERRKFLVRIVVATALVAAVYLPMYWDRTGGFAQPARAVRSAVAPSPRDESSNLYRVQEDANLLLNIRQSGPLGKGFGVPIDYALPIVDISDIDPLIAYIPHNGVLYVLMRMGVLGAIAFWAMLGVGIVVACRLARSHDRELAVVGALLVSVLVGYAFQGYVDQGFFFYRVAFVVGTLLGLADIARRLAVRGGTPGAANAGSSPAGPMRA